MVRELNLQEELGAKQLEGSHPHSYMRRFMSQLSMQPREFMWGEALALALLPQVGREGAAGRERGVRVRGRGAAHVPRSPSGSPAAACCRPPGLQEGPEANVHTPWHGKSPTSIAGTVVYIIANLPGKTHVGAPGWCTGCRAGCRASR